jgi:hypothetical protein
MALGCEAWMLCVVISCVHTKGPDTRKENQRIGERNHLVLDARMNVEKLGGPWSCSGIFRVLCCATGSLFLGTGETEGGIEVRLNLHNRGSSSIFRLAVGLSPSGPVTGSSI